MIKRIGVPLCLLVWPLYFFVFQLVSKQRNNYSVEKDNSAGESIFGCNPNFPNESIPAR